MPKILLRYVAVGYPIDFVFSLLITDWLWVSDQPDAETSTWQHTTLITDRHPCPSRDWNPQSLQASGRRPTPQAARPPGSSISILIVSNMTHYGNRRLLLMPCAFKSDFYVTWRTFRSVMTELKQTTPPDMTDHSKSSYQSVHSDVRTMPVTQTMLYHITFKPAAR